MQIALPDSSRLAAFLRRWQLAILAAITLLAAVLRFYALPDIPPGLHVDEAWSGVMARQVLQTGQLQVFFPSNQGVEPIVVYMAVPIVALLGSPMWQLRIPEALAGTLTIPALWWMIRELYGRRSARPDNPPTEDEFVYSSLLGLGSALVLAIMFWHINLSRIELEPILVPLFMCLTFATLARALETGRRRDFVVAGIVLAGNMYTYKAGYAVPPLAAAFLAYTAIFDRGFLKREWRNLLVMFGVAVLTYVPMIIFAVTHPADFFQRFGSVTVESRYTPHIDLGQNTLNVLGMFFVAGDANERYNIPGRPALDPLMGILFLIGLGRSVLALRNPRHGLLVLWLGVMSLPTLLSEFAPQWGRAIGTTPMIAAMCALGGISAWQLAARVGKRWASLAAVGAVGLTVIVSGITSARDYFVTFSHADYLFYSFDEGNVALSNKINAMPANQRVYLVTPLTDYYTFIYVIDRPYDTFDGRNGTVYPPPGQAATTVVILQRNQPMLRALRAARPDATETWQIKDRNDKPYARAVSLPAVDHPAPQPSHPLRARVGDGIQLLGYDTDATQVVPGSQIALTIYWLSLKPVSQNFTVFTHLIADTPLPNGGTLLAGADREPVAASYRTSIWRPGETILDRHLISIPADAPPGIYHLHVGMYLLATLERLPAVDSGGQPVPDNSIDLGSIEVVTGK